MPMPPRPAASPRRAARNLELLDSADRQEMIRVLQDSASFAARLPIVVAGQRKISFDVRALKVAGGSAGVAVDAGEVAALSSGDGAGADGGCPSPHARPAADRRSPFDADHRLTFYNAAYRALWDFDQAFLDFRPDDLSAADRLRAARKLPEQRDFRQWKAELHEAYRAVEATEDVPGTCPTAAPCASSTTPKPGGGVTYLFHDVTERPRLDRALSTELIRVQRETLDNLAEARRRVRRRPPPPPAQCGRSRACGSSSA